FLAQRLVCDVLCTQRNYLVVRAVARTLRHSVWAQVRKAISAAGLNEHFDANASEMSITCRENGGQILFAGLDDAEKLKSLTPARGVLTDVWMEEAAEADRQSFKQLSKRLRGRVLPAGAEPGAEPKKRITLSFNPAGRGHWIWREFFAGVDEEKPVHRGRDLLIVKTTHRDNAFLTPGDRGALEGEDDPWYYEVYTRGNWASADGVVYTNWRVCELPPGLAAFDNLRCGLDFGFAQDPNALVVCHVDARRRRLYVLSEFVRGGLHDDELAREVAKRINDEVVVCDSAEPKAISDLCRRGVRAVPAVKGPDSVRYGIRFLQGYEILVHPDCPQMAAELAAYRWQRDKNGQVLPRPEDRDNHLLDALRYAVEDLMLQSRAEAVRRL
ncbi:PBSX family phage terminase large subunit, partial [Ruminococcaceae bacterium OttesenSCG-928-I18]|nr:PBSX family phage terminase large subunit [Ruminococcaceae bacterium OttesenSCG-928-I18]